MELHFFLSDSLSCGVLYTNKQTNKKNKQTRKQSNKTMLSCYSSTALEGQWYIHSHFSLLPFPLPERERKANTLGPPSDPTHLQTSLARGTPSSVHKVFTPLLSFTSHSSCASLTKSSGSFLCSRGMSSGGGMPLWCNLGQGATRDHLLFN